MGRRAIRLLFAVLAVGFFAAPIALRAVGVTAEAFENRPFATAPKLSQGWDAFGQATLFLTDRMPLRAQAVRANTRIWTDVLGTTPRYGDQGTEGAVAAQVIRGDDGWLYLQGEQDRSCAPAIPVATALARWAGLVALVRASGRRAIAIVPPDKASVYPEHLPDDFPNEDCAASGKEELWRLLERSAERTGVLPLRAALLREKRREADPLYLPRDSHWNDVGALSLVRESLARLDAGIGVRPSEAVDPGDAAYVGDLTALLGETEGGTHPQRTIVRDPRARRVPGRTLLVKDSYGEASTPQLAPYFEDLRTVLWVGTPAQRIGREIAAADTVILETVEREFALRAGPEGFVGPLAVELRKRLDRR
jgi:hypothetical protein